MIASQDSPFSNLRHASGEVATKRLEFQLPAVCQDRRLVAGLVMRGVGVTIFPESMARNLEKQGAVLRPMAWPHRQAWVYHRDGHISTAAQRFLDLIGEPPAESG
jgi:DNA-binding transcriptional LysR family regulator